MSKINQLDGGAISSGTGGAVDTVAQAKSVGSGATGSGSTGSTDNLASESPESVSITQSGRTLAALSQAVQDSPEIDGPRVAALRQSIESGSYSIDDDAIAGSMWQIEQDLGGMAQ